jgi:DNA-binding SARP family transcriptional activator
MSAPGDYEITQYKQGFYLPSENLVRHYDVEAFVDAVDQALESSDAHEMEILLRQALNLYKGHYLEDSDTAWAARRREQLLRLHCEACIWMARILERRGEREEAIELYTQAIHECPQREDVHRAIIRLYLQLGRADRAREQYRVLDRELYQRLGISPTRESLDLLHEIDSGSGKSSR